MYGRKSVRRAPRGPSWGMLRTKQDVTWVVPATARVTMAPSNQPVVSTYIVRSAVQELAACSCSLPRPSLRPSAVQIYQPRCVVLLPSRRTSPVNVSSGRMLPVGTSTSFTALCHASDAYRRPHAMILVVLFGPLQLIHASSNCP